MKTKKIIALAILVVGGLSMFLTSCSDDTTTEIIRGCTNSAAVNFNASATEDNGTCILLEQLDDTTRTYYSAAAHAANSALAPYVDKAHCSVRWESSYKDLGFSLITGRFAQFDASIVFNEKDPSKTKITGWVQIASNLTGEDGRDNWETNGCMPRDLGVEYTAYHNECCSGNPPDSFRVNDIIDAATDTAYFETNNVEFYFANKNGWTTSYKATATLRFRPDGNGGLKTSTVDFYFNYNGLDYGEGRSGFEGYFDFNAISDHGCTSTNIADKVTVLLNAQVRGL